MNSEFKVFGHVCVLGTYPSQVIPVGLIGNERFVVIYSLDGPQVKPIGETEFRSHKELIIEYADAEILESHILKSNTQSASMSGRLPSFDYKNDLLYALSKEKVVVYPSDQRVNFYRTLLSIKSFSEGNPFIRLELAEIVGVPDMFIQELKACILYLVEQNPNSVDPWYSSQLESLSVEETQRYSLPKSWKELDLDINVFETGSGRISWMEHQDQPSVIEARREEARKPGGMTDKTLTCVDCGYEFTFTAGEQEYFASRGYTNEPRRCPQCRAARRSQERGFRDSFGREM